MKFLTLKNNQNSVHFFLTTFILVMLLMMCTKIKIKPTEFIDSSIPNWTMYGGNPQRTNAYVDSINFPLELFWLKKASSAIEKALVIVDSVIYLGTMDGKIQTVHIQTGDKLGEKKVDFAATCAYHDHHLIIGRRYGDHTLYNLDLKKGKFVWQTNAGDISSEPLVTAKGIIVTALYNHADLYALESGVKIWTFETQDQLRSSPAMAHNIVVFGSDDGYVYALDAGSGKLLWKFKTNDSVQSTAAIDADKRIVYIGSSDFYFYALKLESGEQIWKFKTNGQILNGAALKGGKVIFGSTDNKIYCLRSITGELLWQFVANSIISTSPLIAGQVVFCGSLDYHLYALDIERGTPVWKYKTKGRIRTMPVVWDNYLVCASEDDLLYVFKPSENTIE